MRPSARRWVDANKMREAADCLRIAAKLATNPQYARDCRRLADWLQTAIKRIGYVEPEAALAKGEESNG